MEWVTVPPRCPQPPSPCRWTPPAPLTCCCSSALGCAVPSSLAAMAGQSRRAAPPKICTVRVEGGNKYPGRGNPTLPPRLRSPPFPRSGIPDSHTPGQGGPSSPRSSHHDGAVRSRPTPSTERWRLFPGGDAGTGGTHSSSGLGPGHPHNPPPPSHSPVQRYSRRSFRSRSPLRFYGPRSRPVLM